MTSMNTRRRLWMVFGFAAAFAGDWMLAVRGSPTRSTGFLAGTGFFALAHVFWTIGQLKDSRPDMRALVAFGLPVVAFASIRLAPVFSFATSAAIIAVFRSQRRFAFSGVW